MSVIPVVDGGQCPPYASMHPVLVRVVALEMAQIKEVRAIKGQLDEKMSKLQGWASPTIQAAWFAFTMAGIAHILN
jgi:hypothetical protein